MELKIELIQSQNLPLAKVEPNKGQLEGLPANPRIIRDRNFRKLKKSIEDNPEMTAMREILVFPTGGDRFIIIGGNMRYEAMKSLGIEKAPCKVIPSNTPVEKLRQIVMKDNSGYGEWDYDLLNNEWDAELIADCCIDIPDLEKIETEEEATEDDYDPSQMNNSTPRTKVGDIWQLGAHRLVIGDSTKAETLAALMQDETADCIITDPPYNVNYESADGKKIENDHMASQAFQDFLVAAFTATNDHLKQGGAFYIWHADSEGYNFRTAAKRTGWQIRQCLIWNKNSFVLGRQDYQWKHEPCLYGWKEGAGHYFTPRRDLSTVMEQAQSLDIDSLTKAEMQTLLHTILESDIPTSVIDEAKPLRSSEHPTMKPIPLIGRQIKNSSRKREIILDPFGGSGSTLVAAEQLHRRCYTIELDPHYADVIIDRWETLTGKEADLAGNFLNNTEGTTN